MTLTNDTYGPFESLLALSNRIKARTVSPVEVTQAVLERIKRTDDHYGAYVLVDEAGAMAAAREAESAIAAGDYKGPLHGVPLAVKDIFGTENLPTRCGSVISEELVPERDAPVVRRLRRAGAVILGKTATTEFALSGYHPTLSPPQNPWGHDRWAGVSSSGSGVAVAAGLAYGALGTDTGGSVRYPAAANGCVGMKPSYDLLSREGVFPLAESLDHVGVFGRRVGDAALLLDVCAGTAQPSADRSRPSSVRIGLDRTLVEQSAHPEVAASLSEALAVLESLGHELVELDLSIFSQLAELWGATTAMEAWHGHKDLFEAHADEYGPVFRNLLEEGQRLTSEQKNHIIETREGLVAQLISVFDLVDVLACPSCPMPAMPLAEFPPQQVLPPEAVSQFLTFTAAANFGGLPTISAPCGFSSETMPISLQLIGPRNSERTIIHLMEAFEGATDWKTRVPPAMPN